VSTLLEVRTLLKTLACGHSHIRYSAPDPEDRPGVDFDAHGRLDMGVLQELGVPGNAGFYICGPPAFIGDLTAGLTAWGIAKGQIHTELFGAGPSRTPGVAASPQGRPHLPAASWRRAADFVRPEWFERSLGSGIS
jgi:ferredoxin-NADP reductase